MSRLWAVTSYFNPAGFRRKSQNYRAFRERLKAPLVTVELSQNAPFELVSSDAEKLVQLRGGDTMWQKERLLNIAISHLPMECEYVAWLDCDIVFDGADWVSAAIGEMQRSNLCQLFRTVYHLRADTPTAEIGRDAAHLQHCSIGRAVSLGLTTACAGFTDGIPGVYKRGHAWCARRDLLEEHGLYDRNVLGSGDRMFVHAATGQVEEVLAAIGAAPLHAEDYRQWAVRFQRDAGRIGYIEGDIFHLWHGDFADRKYTVRHRILNAHGYDPATDIALDGQGCWRWNSHKPEMHQLIRQYFEERAEDGPRVVSECAGPWRAERL